VLEIPHQGRGIEKVDGGDAQARISVRIHSPLDYQFQEAGCAARTFRCEGRP
jgi:hypothetical protein